MRGVAVIALGAGFVACAEPAAVVPGKVRLTRPENEYQVNGTAFQMNFPPDDGDRSAGVQLPHELFIGGDATNALGNAGCPVESLVGIGLYPTAIAAGDLDDATPSTPGTGGISIVHGDVEGSAVLSLAVTYDIPYTCDVESERMIGTSTFTFFPSSRIVRHDLVSAAANPVMGATGCATCGAPESAWYFTSFWTFAASTVRSRTGAEIAPGNFNVPVPEACVQIGTNVVALGWLGTELTRAMAPSQTTSAMVYDFQRGGTDLMPGPREVTSAIQLGFGVNAETECSALLGALATPPLEVNGTPVQTNGDGIYVDPAVHTGTISIAAEDGDVAPFAIILDLGGARHARVSRPYGEYMIQDVPSTTNPNDFLFWFDNGVSNFADAFTIEPY